MDTSLGATRSTIPTTDQKEAFARRFAVHVGVDTGKRFHKLVARGPDGRRRRAVRVDVSRTGFDSADEYIESSFPGLRRSSVLVGLEFGGHHGSTFAQYLRERGYATVAVLPSGTTKLKEGEDSSPRKDEPRTRGRSASCSDRGSSLRMSP